MSEPEVASGESFRAPAAAESEPSPTASEAKGRHLLRFVWHMDAEGHFTVDSDEFRTLIGTPANRLLAERWEAVSNELGLDPEGSVARAIASRETWSGVTVAWPIAGERVEIELSGLPVFDRERNFHGYRGFGICHELTRLETLASAGAARPARAETEGSAPGSAADRADAPLLTAVEHHAFRELERRLNEQLSPATEDSDGGEIAVGGTKTPPLTAVTETGTDRELPPAEAATEALDAAHRANAEFRAILDFATDAIIVLDRSALVADANRSAQALFGSGANRGEPFLALFTPGSRERARHYLEQVEAGDPGKTEAEWRELIGRGRDGNEVPVGLSLRRLGSHSDTLCALVRDLSERKKSEGALIEARHEADMAAQAKADILARINHEIRIPLNAIIGFSEVMIQERFGPIGNSRYREYVRDIHAAGDELLSLVNGLIDLSKLEAGTFELSFSAMGINDLTQACVTQMQPQANRERVIIRTSLAPKLPPVLADALTMRQIILHLLSNSIKLTGAGGQVIVSTAPGENGSVVFRVRDTGPGMTQKEIASALEPFGKLAISIKDGSEAVSLDLPLTKALVEANHASFHIESRPNAGTLIEVAFPAARVLV